jgi:predicted thioesterase
MYKDVKPGLSFTASLVVGMENTAIHYKSGTLVVFATPAMIALMENAAMNAVLPHLPKGFTTVGVKVDVRHTKATPIGMKVESKAILTQVDDKKLVFEVNAYDEDGEIGSGTHTRYIVDTMNFMNKALETKET